MICVDELQIDVSHDKQRVSKQDNSKYYISYANEIKTNIL